MSSVNKSAFFFRSNYLYLNKIYLIMIFLTAGFGRGIHIFNFKL